MNHTLEEWAGVLVNAADDDLTVRRAAVDWLVEQGYQEFKIGAWVWASARASQSHAWRYRFIAADHDTVVLENSSIVRFEPRCWVLSDEGAAVRFGAARKAAQQEKVAREADEP